MSGNKKLFLSAVKREFIAYRELLAKDLARAGLDVAMQEDFIVTGGSTLAKLDGYIRSCDGVVHLVGKATGSPPEEPALAALVMRYPDFAIKVPSLAPYLSQPQPGFSYTQWEAYLAMYHRRPLFVYRSADFGLDTLSVPRDHRFVLEPDEVRAQEEHYRRISDLGRDRGQFLNEERLSSAVLRDLLEVLPRLGTTQGTHAILFLCYRREDTSDAAGRLHDRLVNAYGDDCVFMDIDSVPLGIDFVDHVSEQISKCRAVIVMIGKQWIKVKDKRRRRRLDNEDDLVRAEIAAALQQKVPVIPVLVQDATMPVGDELPENIRLLARRNGISISASRWRTDVERLIKELDPVMKR